MKQSERYSYIIDWFDKNMPTAESELHYSNAFELLVAIVLSAQCTDKRVNQTTPALFSSYPTPQVMANASIEDIQAHIKSISYPHNKAKHLQGLSQTLVKDFNGVVPDTIDELQKLPGVGRKTANVMLAVYFGKAAMPVDTHVFRVAHRIGFVTASAKTPFAVEQQLSAHIPESLLSKAHHWLLLHGRYVCTARNPQCATCGIKTWCKYITK
ncbi:MAG: endonuclease III [Bacteroidia bacterium]|nr:endonuclease III [Bacteroidia bacterium]